MVRNDPLAVPDVLHDDNATRVVWRLAWPAVALNSMQIVNTLLDRGFIGHLSTASLTAHGGSTGILFLMFSLAMALATGATAIVSRAFGAENPLEFRAGTRQSLALAMWIGVALAIVTFTGARTFASWFLPAQDVAAQAEMASFLRGYAAGLPAICVIQTLAGCLRGIGDTKSPMIISGLQILLHIGLNFLLIFPAHRLGSVTIPGAGLGLVGASTALSISAWCAAIVYILYAERTPLGAQLAFPIPDREWARRILRVAMPAAAMNALRVFSLMAFTLVLKVLASGSTAIAAMSVGFAIESVMFMPAFGLSAAAAALVGQSLGMKNVHRAERLAWTAAHYGALVTILIALPIYFAAPGIAELMLPDKPAIVVEASRLLRYLCVTEVLFAYAMVMVGAMQGAGDTIRPLWISIFSLWGLRVPLAALMALPVGLGLGSNGAWLAMAMTQGIQGVLAIALFRQGRWKQMSV